MKLNHPFCISSRLIPAVKVGKESWVSITFANRAGMGGRVRYRYYIDGPDLEHTGDDQQSSVGGGSIQEGMRSLLSFLGAAAEAYRYSMTGRESDNDDLFPPDVMEWAYQNSEELAMLECELQENEDLIEDFLRYPYPPKQ